jgi:hypothetical protein
MKLLETEIQIAATPEVVWSILTDFEKYVNWNPFIKKVTGKVNEGEELQVTICQAKGNDLQYKATVKSLIKYQQVSWLGRFLFPGVFDGEHIFNITENKGGCLFVQKEYFSGFLVPLLWGSLNKDTRRAFRLMNAALKQRAESTSMQQEVKAKQLGSTPGCDLYIGEHT